VRAAAAAQVALCALLAGCASSNFSMRTLPAETPAADNAAAIHRAQALRAQVQAAASGAQTQAQADLGPPLTAEDIPSSETYDPWERMNRFTYRFNARFDETLFLPAADQYGRLPARMRGSVHNFFSNLTEVVSVLNYAAQLRPAQSGRSLGRFVINSTLGIGGLMDVATQFHIPAAKTGFGDTLARWGIRPGPYLVVPLFGPSTVRDGFGFAADYATGYFINILNLYRGLTGWLLTPLAFVDLRANTDFRYYATGSPFEYDTVRFLYVRRTLLQDDALRFWWRSGPPNPHAPAGE
jgi:phospholipid-binding lipoprotein MlaA